MDFMADRLADGRQFRLLSVLDEWAERRGIALNYIQPGKPRQNAYVERRNVSSRLQGRDRSRAFSSSDQSRGLRQLRTSFAVRARFDLIGSDRRSHLLF